VFAAVGCAAEAIRELTAFAEEQRRAGSEFDHFRALTGEPPAKRTSAAPGLGVAPEYVLSESVYFREYSIVIIFISFLPPGGVPYISKVW
jgi:hypothetical protein